MDKGTDALRGLADLIMFLHVWQSEHGVKAILVLEGPPLTVHHMGITRTDAVSLLESAARMADGIVRAGELAAHGQ